MPDPRPHRPISIPWTPAQERVAAERGFDPAWLEQYNVACREIGVDPLSPLGHAFRPSPPADSLRGELVAFVRDDLRAARAFLRIWWLVRGRALTGRWLRAAWRTFRR